MSSLGTGRRRGERGGYSAAAVRRPAVVERYGCSHKHFCLDVIGVFLSPCLFLLQMPCKLSCCVVKVLQNYGCFISSNFQKFKFRVFTGWSYIKRCKTATKLDHRPLPTFPPPHSPPPPSPPPPATSITMHSHDPGTHLAHGGQCTLPDKSPTTTNCRQLTRRNVVATRLGVRLVGADAARPTGHRGQVGRRAAPTLQPPPPPSAVRRPPLAGGHAGQFKLAASWTTWERRSATLRAVREAVREAGAPPESGRDAHLTHLTLA